MDQLHHHLKAGGKLKSFVPITDVEIENGHDTAHDTGKITTTHSTTHPSQQELLAQIALLITEAKDPL